MIRRNEIVPFNDEPAVNPYSFDAQECSLYAAPPDHIVDLIEEERCERSPECVHVYIARNHCNYCNTPAPWIRRDACRQP